MKLRELYLQHPHPVVRCRALTLILKSQAIAHHKIANTVGLCTNTVREYFGMYQQGGIDQLTIIHFSKARKQISAF
jgi:hypothetical protein